MIVCMYDHNFYGQNLDDVRQHKQHLYNMILYLNFAFCNNILTLKKLLGNYEINNNFFI